MKPIKNNELDVSVKDDALKTNGRTYRPPFIDANIGRQARAYCASNGIPITDFIEQALKEALVSRNSWKKQPTETCNHK